METNKTLTKITTTENVQLWKNNWKGALGAIKVTKDMSFTDLRKLDTPSVSMMNYGEKTTENGVRIFQALVLNIVKFLGAEWTDDQILECGKICFDEANYLTFAELSHFAQKAKAGGFEKVYGKFTTATFMEWFTLYTEQNFIERTGYFSGADKKIEWTEPANPVPTEKVKSFLKEFTDNLQTQIQIEQAEEQFKFKEEQARQVEVMKSKLTSEQLKELENE